MDTILYPSRVQWAENGPDLQNVVITKGQLYTQ